MRGVNLPGLRFWPTDEEVVKCYLRTKAMGEPLPGSFMIERDLYGEKSPWEILMNDNNIIDDRLPWQTFKSRDKNDRIKTDATIFVATPLKKAGRGGGCDTNRRNSRSAGCGAWHGENGQEIIDVAGGHVIGYKKMFIFEVQNESVAREIEMGSMIQRHWIMHEYTLNDDDRCPFAICKLMVDDFKKVKIAPKSRIRKKSVGVQIHEEAAAAAAMRTTQLTVAAVAKEVVMVSDCDKIYDREYYTRTSKRVREEEEEDNNHPRKGKKMHLLSEEANTSNHHVLPIDDHPVVAVPPVQRSPSITTTSGDDRLLKIPPLQLVEEEKRFQEEVEEPITVQQQPATTTATTASCYHHHHMNTEFMKPQNQRVHDTNGDGNETGNGSLVKQQTTIEPSQPTNFLFDDDFGIDEYFDHLFDMDLYLDPDKVEEFTEDHLHQELEEPGVVAPLDHCHYHQEIPPPALELPPNTSTTAAAATNRTEDEFIEVP